MRAPRRVSRDLRSSDVPRDEHLRALLRRPRRGSGRARRQDSLQRLARRAMLRAARRVDVQPGRPRESPARRPVHARCVHRARHERRDVHRQRRVRVGPVQRRTASRASSSAASARASAMRHRRPRRSRSATTARSAPAVTIACEVGAYCDDSTSTVHRGQAGRLALPEHQGVRRRPPVRRVRDADLRRRTACRSNLHASGRCGDEGLYCGNDQICHYVALAGEACGTGQQCSNYYTTCNPTSQTCVDVSEARRGLQRVPALQRRRHVLRRDRVPGAEGERPERATTIPSARRCYCDTSTTLTCMAPPTCPL